MRVTSAAAKVDGNDSEIYHLTVTVLTLLLSVNLKITL